MFHKFLLILAYFTIQSSAQAEACNTLDSVNWLVGSWTSDSPTLKISETWSRISSHTFEGHGKTVSVTQNELVSAETLRLVEMSGELFFWAKVKSNELPVAFKLTNCTDNTATFENAAHDFPKKLVYQKTNVDMLTVLVTGNEGKGFTIEYTRSDDR